MTSFNNDKRINTSKRYCKYINNYNINNIIVIKQYTFIYIQYI